mgnify:CR=1 FL=1
MVLPLVETEVPDEVKEMERNLGNTISEVKKDFYAVYPLLNILSKLYLSNMKQR